MSDQQTASTLAAALLSGHDIPGLQTATADLQAALAVDDVAQARISAQALTTAALVAVETDLDLAAAEAAGYPASPRRTAMVRGLSQSLATLHSSAQTLADGLDDTDPDLDLATTRAEGIAAALARLLALLQPAD